jgi:hypothetical protein
MAEIMNCTWPFRDAQCPRAFTTTLRKTDKPNVAVCESCLEFVYLCRTAEEADARMRRGERAAKGFFLPGEVIVGTFVTKPVPDEPTAG